jgi:hypothetical protein
MWVQSGYGACTALLFWLNNTVVTKNAWWTYQEMTKSLHYGQSFQNWPNPEPWLLLCGQSWQWNAAMTTVNFNHWGYDARSYPNIGFDKKAVPITRYTNSCSSVDQEGRGHKMDSRTKHAHPVNQSHFAVRQIYGKIFWNCEKGKGMSRMIDNC